MIKKLLHFLCLIIPVLCAAGGIFLAVPLWGLFNDGAEITPEWFKFITSAVCFAVPALVIFLLTRKENPVLRITAK